MFLFLGYPRWMAYVFENAKNLFVFESSSSSFLIVQRRTCSAMIKSLHRSTFKGRFSHQHIFFVFVTDICSVYLSLKSTLREIGHTYLSESAIVCCDVEWHRITLKDFVSIYGLGDAR